MILRKLEMKDAPYMLAWMHDENVVDLLRANFKSKKIEDCESFIASSRSDDNEVHLAIASEDDEYMGTVSLKSIDKIKGTAEFAIVVRGEAMGKGYAWFGMREIINRAFTDYGLVDVYWCVSKHNARAIRFYEKHHYKEIDSELIPKSIMDDYEDVSDLKWFSASVSDGINYEK